MGARLPRAERQGKLCDAQMPSRMTSTSLLEWLQKQGLRGLKIQRMCARIQIAKPLLNPAVELGEGVDTQEHSTCMFDGKWCVCTLRSAV